jgi:mannosyltransferase OCH1-like enzyme
LGTPDKVWQTAELNNLTEGQRDWSNIWTTKNPSFRLELLTDRSSEILVRTHYLKTRPDIVEAYEALPIPIMRADLLRYLMLLAEGGVWSDLDARCDKQVSEWVPPEYRDHEIDMIVGLEFDFEWRGPRTQVASQFTNWVFAARLSSHNLKVVVDAVVETIKDSARSNRVSIAELTLDMLPIDVVNVTGPKIMTIQILKVRVSCWAGLWMIAISHVQAPKARR